MASTSQEQTGLRRGLSIWQAVGISVALMAPSMAANINPQGTAGLVGRATPLAFFLAAVAVLLIAYVFVRLCQYYQHAGSVYVFAGATLGPRAGATAGLSLLGTYTFYALVTASATGVFGAQFLDDTDIWTDQPSWAGFVVGGLALVLVLWLAIVPARRATSTLLVIEGLTVLLIVVIALIAFIQMAAGTAPGGAELTLDVFKVEPGTDTSTLFLGIIFGLLSFAGFEAAATLGEEARDPRRDIPRAILGTAIFGGIYFTFVTAVEMMAFGTDAEGVEAFVGSGALMGDIGTAYIASWVGETVTLGAAVSAFACCLACVVGASRLLYAVSRDASPGLAISRTGRNDTPAAAAVVVSIVVALIALVCAVFFGAEPFDTFLWSGTIGTLILLVAYVLATIGCIKLLFVDRKMTRADVGGRHPARRPGDARLHDLAQRHPLPRRQPRPVVPGRRVRVGAARGDRHGRLARDSPGSCRCRSRRPTTTRVSRVSDETPYVAGPLVDHHCHGLVRRDLDRPAFESLMNEGAGAGRWTGSPFDSMLGVAVLRHCAPLLGLEPHADADTYLGRRQALGHDEVARRLLGAAGIDTLLVDTGFLPGDICSPAEVAALAGPEVRSHEIAAPGDDGPGPAGDRHRAARAAATPSSSDWPSPRPWAPRASPPTDAVSTCSTSALATSTSSWRCTSHAPRTASPGGSPTAR